jgi:hypothetical protein
MFRSATQPPLGPAPWPPWPLWPSATTLAPGHHGLPSPPWPPRPLAACMPWPLWPPSHSLAALPGLALLASLPIQAAAAELSGLRGPLDGHHLALLRFNVYAEGGGRRAAAPRSSSPNCVEVLPAACTAWKCCLLPAQRPQAARRMHVDCSLKLGLCPRRSALLLEAGTPLSLFCVKVGAGTMLVSFCAAGLLQVLC